MSDVETAMTLARHSAGQEAILNAARLLRRHGMRDASDLILTHVAEITEAKPSLPKTWPFPTNAEEALL
jgi:riboflavin biosynthesis pyrimidine reductase